MLHQRSVAFRERSAALQELSASEEERSVVFLGSAARPSSRSGDPGLDSSFAAERSPGRIEPSDPLCDNASGETSRVVIRVFWSFLCCRSLCGDATRAGRM